jgi:hypothetical protein
LPRDDRVVPAARQWVHSDDPLARCMAAGVFAAFPDPQDTDALQRLLDDPFIIDDPQFLSPWSGREYLVRERAWRALDKQHVVVPSVTGALPRAGLYVPVSWWRWGLFAAVPMLVYGGLRRWRRLRKGLRRPSIWRSAVSFFTFACVGLAVGAAACWHRSMHTADDIVFARYGGLLEITCVQDNVFLECGYPWPVETSLVHSAITPDPTPRSLFERSVRFRNGYGTAYMGSSGSIWDVYFGPAVRWSWIIGAGQRGIDTQPIRLGGAAPVCQGVVLGIAYPYLIAILLSFPAARVLLALIRVAWRKWRAARIARMGLCPQCSYDLRAHKAGQRCPECGRMINAQSAGCVVEKQ